MTKTALVTKTSEQQSTRELQRQSLRQTQALMMASVSSIAYLRELFPDRAFEADRSTGLELKRLTRGHQSNVDRFLDWLERGIADALERRILRTLSLNIFLDRKHPNRVVECYSLHFSYMNDHNDGGEQREDPSCEMDIRRNQTMIVQGLSSGGPQELRKVAATMLRQLCSLTATLPLLPEKKYIQLTVDYYERMSYLPEGFKPLTKQSPLKLPDVVHDFGSIPFGHHVVSLKMHRLPDDSYCQREVEEMEDLERIPSTCLPMEDDRPTIEEKCTLTFETPRLVQPPLNALDMSGDRERAAEDVQCYCNNFDVRPNQVI